MKKLLKTSLKSYFNFFSISIIFLIFNSVSGKAQSIYVTGRVETIKETPLQGVHIVNSYDKSGAITDGNGNFKIKISAKPTTLLFTHVGYKDRKIMIEESDIKDVAESGEMQLLITMFVKDTELAPVEITDAIVEIAYDNPKQWITDYELIGQDEILLLLIDKNKNYLQLLDNDEDIISKEIISDDYQKLYKGILDDINLLGADSACQIFLIDEQIIPYYYTPIAEFDIQRKQVVASTDDYLFTKEILDNYTRIVFYKINKEGDIKEKTIIANIFDTNKDILLELIDFDERISKNANEEKIRRLEEIGQRIAELSSDHLNRRQNNHQIIQLEHQSLSVKFNYASNSSSGGSMSGFYRSMLPIETYLPLLNINNMLYLFNHIEGKILCFDNDGDLLDEVEIDYHNSPYWTKEIIVNEEQTQCFVKYTKDGITTLHELDLDTGTFLQDIVLERHVFPTKIRIRENTIYYLARNYIDAGNKFLWKQKYD
ncbi:carboxypeptidase-like regulatory domain-containing protein [Bacteroidales bacterium OttesenSCG-928-K03]|nr:carboxypeptidase-like regulatory domain-containing protein [Odoribacter sp. OttesenSCG-928-L07]MDL2239255.1 carboxypeptidase-like regulatory domain-containing protein [Bacteroidales bacterium OttesenSCG-928-L14]MDL2242379.1 carboxypeptidase-like regulatory domain-containing protein [Bacteroidales bacterium OttesenSCG-928-K03]